MPDVVPPHTHCQICGKAIPVSEKLCSTECKEKYDTMVKRRKMYIYAMYVLIALIFVLYLFGSGII